MKENYKMLGVIVLSITLFLLLLGTGVILNQELTTGNAVTMVAYGLAAGMFAGALAYLDLKIGLYLFLAGLFIGFIEMYRNFLFGDGGFQDLAGLLSLFMFTAFGLVLAFVVEGIRFFLKKKQPPTM